MRAAWLALALVACGGSDFSDSAAASSPDVEMPEASSSGGGSSSDAAAPVDEHIDDEQQQHESEPAPEEHEASVADAAPIVLDADWTGPQWGFDGGQIHSCSQDVDCQPACETYGMRSFCAGGGSGAPSTCKSTQPFLTGCGDCECKCDASDPHQVYECRVQCIRGGYTAGRCANGMCGCL